MKAGVGLSGGGLAGGGETTTPWPKLISIILIFYFPLAASSSPAGYNGLPSIMSGLDDSLSDVAAKKKYPFELEKAIHNVMFIQHHMQRQDEFNAVSGSQTWHTLLLFCRLQISKLR